MFRARVVNPRWIDAMKRHGYKGAFELAATVDYLFGYDATAGVVEDWMYEQLTPAYVLDEDMREFLAQSNPWALHGIAERLLEAADRKLWDAPEADTLAALRDAYLEVEGHWKANREPRSPGRCGDDRRAVVRDAVAATLPFSAVVGMDDARLALLLNAVAPAIGGVLRPRREGHREVHRWCARWPRSCPPSRSWPGAGSPATRPRPTRAARTARTRRAAPAERRPARLVELPVGATEDRLTGALDIGRGRSPRASRPSSPGCWPPRTGASCTSTRSTCCTTTWWTCCSTPPPWAPATWSGTASRCATRAGSCWSAP